MKRITLQGEPIAMNPIEACRTAPEYLVDFLEQLGEVSLDSEQRKALRVVVDDLPEGASMRDLIEALKAKEAAELGISLEQYEALTPLFRALQAMQEKGPFSLLFTDGSDK
ncbi:hypothetical protein HB746_34415 [Pseudomonas aeruginosa]|uniref:hypothetical protein n=1 Tax=Pseudomonas aeruginosa TaxID=287 RepID=UPI00155EDFDE|nr:hypothetical protein [Pseudomonas aeruginosa]NRC34066.1 hypothetical protein [Pseudomonas aeruginosa]